MFLSSLYVLKICDLWFIQSVCLFPVLEAEAAAANVFRAARRVGGLRSRDAEHALLFDFNDLHAWGFIVFTHGFNYLFDFYLFCFSLIFSYLYKILPYNGTSYKLQKYKKIMICIKNRRKKR